MTEKNKMEYDDDVNRIKDKNTIKISKKTFYILLLCNALVFIACILATYYGKSCKDTQINYNENQLVDQCKSYLCKNFNLFETWQATCINPSAQTSSSTSSAQISTSQTTTIKPPNKFRLPSNVKPTLYELEIKPYIGPVWDQKNWTFEGRISMHLECLEPTDKIVFHQKELNLTLDGFTSSDDDGIEITNKNFNFDYEKDFVTANLNRQCIKNKTYNLKLNFSGIILDKLYGFYRSSYLDKDGKPHYLAVTKFEPTYARRAFPCFDEPAMKAKYITKIIRPKYLNSFSNNPIKETNPYEDKDWEVDYYEETVPMSTYVVAYVIADFPTISKNSTKKTKVEVSARAEPINNGDGEFALNEAADIIDFFSDYFNVSYPLPKSTQIAIPDFNSGAMENWGLVTYRETNLLYNSSRDTVANKKRVSNVISHELAHQWFGNLVTMSWWNDLWLNEGFASWVEYLGYNFTHPEWRDLDYFFVLELSAFVQDSLESSHPISVEVNDPNEITSLFDGISYSKGASIIRMMNSFLTEYTFRRGVTRYLKKYQFDNAEQDNLWEQLTIQAHEDKTLSPNITVKEIMDTWTLKKGYPVISVERNYATINNQVTLKQKWFLMNPSNVTTDEYNSYKWYVPFTYTIKDELSFTFETTPIWLRPEENESVFQLCLSKDSWIIGNLKHSGFYRVTYDERNWKLLIDQLNGDHLIIDPINRAQLLDDSFNLGRGQVVNQLLFLDITKYLKKELDGLPFVAAFNGLEYISDMLEEEVFVYDYFKKYYMNLVDLNYERLGWNLTIDDVNEINLQLSVVNVMCKFGNPNCKNISRTYYDKWIDENQALPSNFKSIILQTSIKYGSRDDWNKLYNLAINTTDNAEKLRMFRALTYTQDPLLLKRILYLSSDESVIRRQDETTIIGDVANNVYGRKMAFDYLDEKWDDLIRKFGDISFTLPNLVKRVLGKLNTEKDLSNIEAFKIKHVNLGIAANAFKESTETVNSNVIWMKNNLKSISDWLKENQI